MKTFVLKHKHYRIIHISHTLYEIKGIPRQIKGLSRKSSGDNSETRTSWLRAVVGKPSLFVVKAVDTEVLNLRIYFSQQLDLLFSNQKSSVFVIQPVDLYLMVNFQPFWKPSDAQEFVCRTSPLLSAIRLLADVLAFACRTLCQLRGSFYERLKKAEFKSRIHKFRVRTWENWSLLISLGISSAKDQSLVTI